VGYKTNRKIDASSTWLKRWRLFPFRNNLTFCKFFIPFMTRKEMFTANFCITKLRTHYYNELHFNPMVCKSIWCLFLFEWVALNEFFWCKSWRTFCKTSYSFSVLLKNKPALWAIFSIGNFFKPMFISENYPKFASEDRGY